MNSSSLVRLSAAELHLLDLGMPSLEPSGGYRIVARRKEGDLQRLDPLGVAQRRIAGLHDRRADVRGNDRPTGAGQHDHAAHEVGVIHRHGSPHLLPEGMAGDHRLAALGPDHCGDIRRQIMEADTLERSLALADAARLRRRYSVAALDQHIAELHEVRRAAPERWQQHDQRPAAAAIDFHLAGRRLEDRRSKHDATSILICKGRGPH